MLDVENIDEIVSEVGNGITEPFNAKIKDKHVIVKTFNNIESNKVLANEIICYRIAKKIHLPMPNGGICDIKKGILINDNVEFNEERYGLGFYTDRLNKVTNIVNSTRVIQKYVTNKEDLPRIILFDHLIYNKDRHKGNILIDMATKNKKLHIIDHSHVFNLGPLWDEYQLRRFIDEKDYVSSEILEYNFPLYRLFFESMKIDLKLLKHHCEDFKNTLTVDFIQDSVNNLPKEWGISENEKSMLIEYILYRLTNLDRICSVIIEYIH
ncbi:HipA family kinase [Clostridium estertheticum]|uniref:HipA family kinase n=1 Tax=Clostridium estertheticum TaxID=238834 RepID=UPI001C7CAC7D|nr:HipA family kinase [Clostridium estertheticum]MBX4271450.1 hypothetical protein [Clostridium estertheticum]WLC81003.1 hypothetical protein KTC98_07205 [Clostridium estertheticum]